MNDHFRGVIRDATGATNLREIEMIQRLWSGYGEIVRYELEGSDLDRVVVKHVKLPRGGDHPRGWNTDFSHQRKVHSYEVETVWYDKWSNHCDEGCRVPACFAMEDEGNEVLIVLEDLDASGYYLRKNSVSWTDVETCLKWLANFHATFIGDVPTGLWKTGTYWHLETRPDELEVLDDQKLKEAAPAIDAWLTNSPFQTIVHGDAKLANFCFHENGKEVAAVDFQYVGGGCGMKDVAYFVGSCMNENECEKHEAEILDCYFTELKKSILVKEKAVDVSALEANWRELYPVAWTDFHRFLKGWSPGHWKINSYSERVEREVVSRVLKNTK